MSLENLSPLPPEQWAPELETVRDELGTPLNIHNIMAHNPELTRAWMPFRHYIVANSSLAPRHRELLILRIAHHTGADYEWQHHVERGQLAGLDMAEIERVREGPGHPDWRDEEQVLLKAVDEVRDQTQISGETLVTMAAHFSAQQILDLVATCGMYLTLATIINTWDVPME